MAASAAVMLLAAGSTIAAAQEPQSQESKNEVAVTIGRTFISYQRSDRAQHEFFR